MKKFFKKERNEKGEIVPMLISVMVTITVLFSAIDAAVYFGNRNIINAAARDGARTAAIFGWPGDGTQMTTIEAAYGASCTQKTTNNKGETVPITLVNGNSVECAISNNLLSNKSLNGVVIDSISCTTESPSGETRNPSSGIESRNVKIGDITKCEVEWYYRNLPISGFNIIEIGTTRENGRKVNGKDAQVSVGTSKTEVQLSDPVRDITSR